ncbi:MAG TPA: TlpA disulfide reductase family protein [Candidatus Cybelea sp.]|jgi:peroxiredoxin|nr:TlpA disulfide reductase family protein [Candidatus Cybelea sp.]
MQRYIGWAVVALAAIVAAFVAEPYVVSQSPATSGPAALAGRQAPVFPLQDDLGRSVSLDRYRGSIVVMNLWASWCPPCRAEMPDLQQLAKANAHRGVAVVGVNEGESPQKARAFADALQIRFPIWLDSNERYGLIYAALGLPTTVIVDRRGIVMRGFDGPLTLEQMRAAVADAMRSD